jgi:methionine sulfoxide reductase heme-binding subunit
VNSSVLWYATRATGLVALGLLTATVVLGLVTARRTSTPGWPGFVLQDLHRRVSILTVCFLAIHVLTSVLDTYVSIGWLAIVVPFASPYERFFVGLGAVSVDLFIAVFLSSLFRPLIGSRTWRAIHWLAYLSWPISVAHAIGSGTDIRLSWVDGFLGACCFAVVVTVVWRFARAAVDRARASAEDANPRGQSPRAVADTTGRWA